MAENDKHLNMLILKWFSWGQVHGKWQIMKIFRLPTQNGRSAHHTQKTSITFDFFIVNIFKLIFMCWNHQSIK